MSSTHAADGPDLTKSNKDKEDMKTLCEGDSVSNAHRKCRSVAEKIKTTAPPNVYKILRTTKAPRIVVKKPTLPTAAAAPASFYSNAARSQLSQERLREIDSELFYHSYNPMEGIMAGIVLGGFFAFVCLLVVYRTKCKPVIKKLYKRMSKTTAKKKKVVIVDAAENLSCPEPSAGPREVYAGVQAAVVDEEDVCKIFFLDADGNYVFPVTSLGGCCSCSLSVDVSIVKGQQSISSIRRSLSDPNINFSLPAVIKSMNSAVNASAVSNGYDFISFQDLHHLPRRRSSRRRRPDGPGVVGDLDLLDKGFVAIQVIQATPSVSPACSLRSFGSDSSIFPDTSLFIPCITPGSSLNRRRGAIAKADRRVSFSENNNPENCKDNRKSIGPNQCKVIPAMQYLQVPGQQTMPFLLPQLTLETHIAQTSLRTKARRSSAATAAKLSKAGSISSINSDGDGDIFGPTGELLTIEVTSEMTRLANMERARVSICDKDVAGKSKVAPGESCPEPNSVSLKVTVDPLSHYSEFIDDCRSDISELFDHEEFRNQSRFTDADQGSIKSISIDEDDAIGFDRQYSAEFEDKSGELSNMPTTVTTAAKVVQQVHKSPSFKFLEYDEIVAHQADDVDDDDIYASSSSCSISIGSNDDQPGHQITVPVTIEPLPPEMRCSPPDEDIGAAGSGVVWAGRARHPGLVRQETARTDSGLEAEEIAPAYSPAGADDDDEYVRMVLVCDIGVQVCEDSPDLNMTRKFHEVKPIASRAAERRQYDRPTSRSEREQQQRDRQTSQSEREQDATSTSSPKESFETEIIL